MTEPSAHEVTAAADDVEVMRDMIRELGRERDDLRARTECLERQLDAMHGESVYEPAAE